MIRRLSLTTVKPIHCFIWIVLIEFVCLAIGTVMDKLNVGSVVYSMCFHSRLKQVIFGIPQGSEK